MKCLTSLGCASCVFSVFLWLSPLAYAQGSAASEPAKPKPAKEPASVEAPAKDAPPPGPDGAPAAAVPAAPAPAGAVPATPAPAAAPAVVEPAPAAPGSPAPAATAAESAPEKPAPPAGEPRAVSAASTNAPPEVPVAAAAATPEDVEATDGFSGHLGTHQDHWFAWLGVRNDYVHDATFDLFADNDALTVFSVGAGRTVWAAGKLSVAALGLWEIGSRSADTRGNEMSLRVQRIELAPEVRYHLHYRLYGFGRLGLGAEYQHGTLTNELFNGELVSNSWAFAGDLAAGAAIQFAGNAAGEKRRPRAWLVAEGGYSLVTSTALSFEADDSGPERAASDELGDLNLSAPFFRLALLGTY